MASALVLILIGIVYVGYGSRYPLGRLEDPGPGFFPLVIGAMFLAGAVVLCAAWLLHGRKQIGRAPARSRTELGAGSRRLWLLIFLLAAYLVTVEWAGYLFVSPLLVLFSARLMGLRGWGQGLLLGVAMTLGTYLVFVMWLQVPLPVGIWRGN